jgi:hypothetical protein
MQCHELTRCHCVLQLKPISQRSTGPVEAGIPTSQLGGGHVLLCSFSTPAKFVLAHVIPEGVHY